MGTEGKDSSPAESRTSVVTGAFGFSGQQIAKRLLRQGENVRTLTNHPRPELPLYRRVQPFPLDFENPEELIASMKGASVLYNTYWVRFSYGETTHERAVSNTTTLIRAAEAAGVKRIVHVSIANPALDSPLAYYRGKAEVEQAIRLSSLSYAILRPAVLFGKGDILINNIAFLLRHSPVFAIPGNGAYRIQPTFVGDLAELAVEGGKRTDNFIADAAGPETYTYMELVKLIRSAVGSRSWILPVRPATLSYASKALSTMLGDVLLTDEEIEGLMAELLVSHAPPMGHTTLAAWIQSNAGTLGRSYASELARHYRHR
jgi:NADH dehydrogenase